MRPTPLRQFLILVPYVAALLAIVLLAHAGLRILSAERAYLVAERLGSQHQKAAVLNLYRLVESGDDKYYSAFNEALSIPEAYVRALRELENVRPDYVLIEEALLDGGNDARDIGDMTLLFRRFRHLDFLNRVADVWFQASKPIAELSQVGESLREQRGLHPISHEAVQQAIRRIEALEHELTGMEQTFSRALDDGFRRSVRWLSGAFVVLAAFLALLAIAFSRMFWRQLNSIAAAVDASQERLNLVISGSNDGAWDLDMVRDDIYYSPRFKEMLAIPNDEPGYDRRSFIVNVHADDVPLVRTTFYNHVRYDVPYSVDFRLRRRDGAHGWFHARGKVVKNWHGKPIRMAGSVTEISDRKALESELDFLATHDPLTGVLNRRKFKETLGLTLQARGAFGEKPSLLYLDLDQFKVVNDTCGHAAGDQLLRDVSDLFGRNLGQRDVVARLGGDEFAILLDGQSIESSWAFAESVRQAVHDFQFVHQDRAFWLSVSIGLVILEPGLDTIDVVLTNADRACFLAKEEGRNRICLYAQSDRDIVLRREEMDWVSRLRKAISEDRLQLYTQPIVRVGGASDLQTHVEILLRLVDESGNVVPPMAFIPAAERYGLMPEIDRRVIEVAFALFSEHAAATGGAGNEIWAINLSEVTLGDDEFPSFLQRQFMTHKVPFNVICFEVTETAVVSDLRRAGKFMRVMKSLGCRFALDDFGAGA